jgi:peroxiredoxin
MKSCLFPLLLAVVLKFGFRLHGAAYQVGDTVENFSLVNRATGQPMQLADFAGRIVVLEWFAWWCPFCQAAAPQVRDGVGLHYKSRGGNPDGLEVVHVGVNLQSGQEAQTQNFVNRAGLELVLEDFNRSLANRFFPTGGQPLFAIINGVTNSPSHRPWELIYARQGYGQTTFPIGDFRTAIDTVKTAPVAEAPRLAASGFTPEGRLRIAFAARAGGRYRVETSPDLNGWSLATEVTAAGSEEAVELEAGSTARFVRVVLP